VPEWKKQIGTCEIGPKQGKSEMAFLKTSLGSEPTMPSKTRITPKSAAVALLIFCVPAGSVQGQSRPAPHLSTVMPMGGRAGTSFEITVSGQNLDNPQGLYFSLPDVKATLVGAEKSDKAPPPQKKKRGPMAGPQKSFKFKVTLPANARLGNHDIRVITPGGISNPRAFVVGDQKEFVEKEPNNDVPQAQKIELNSTVHGVISKPTDVDYVVFHGLKGQRVIASCQTSSIDSRLPALVEIYSTSGSLLVSGRNYQENDALVDCVLPDDGEYFVRVACFTYTLGGPEYYYRLNITTAPWIDAVFPDVIQPGKEAIVTVLGRNLPGGKPAPEIKSEGRPLEHITVTVKAPAGEMRHRLDYMGFLGPSASAVDGFEFRVHGKTGASNPILLTYADAPVVLDQAENNTRETAQKISVPCVIAGQLEKKSDRDWFRFEVKKGSAFSIELIGDRLGAPADFYFILQNDKGQPMTEQDDSGDIMSPQFYTRTSDPPRYRFEARQDGMYYLLVSSRDGSIQSGPRLNYQVRITQEKPDFRLVAMPAGTTVPDAPVVGRDGNQVLHVLVWRLDGFNGPIELTARDLPPDVAMMPQVIPAGQKQGYLVLSASPKALAWTGAIRVFGTAEIGGSHVEREARPATISWPLPVPNLPNISRLDRSLVLAVRDAAPFILKAEKTRFAVAPGSKITIPIKVLRGRGSEKSNIQVTALNPMPGFAFKNLSLAPGKKGDDFTVTVGNGVKPGPYTLVLRGQAGPAGKKVILAGGNYQPSPPIAITVVPKQLAKLAVAATLKIKPGEKMPLPVKAARLAGYDGPFKIEVILPAKARGIHANARDIAAGKSETSIDIMADDDAPAGPQPGYIVRATGMFHGNPVVQETRVNIVVTRN
jgi:hypothetical protein